MSATEWSSGFNDTRLIRPVRCAIPARYSHRNGAASSRRRAGSRNPFGFWDPARRLLEAAPFRWLYLAGIAHRTGLIRRVSLNPELHSVADMLTLSRRLLEQGVPYLQLA